MHAMIDIETLGVGTSAPLFEVGVVIFDWEARKIIEKEAFYIDLLDVILTTGFLPQKETVKWWQTQEYNPNSFGYQRSPLKESLINISGMLANFKVSHVWGNSPAFDMVIMCQHYEACGLEIPWKFYRELDLRTVKWIYEASCGESQGPWPKSEVSHNALNDALCQTQILFSMFKGLNVFESA